MKLKTLLSKNTILWLQEHQRKVGEGHGQLWFASHNNYAISTVLLHFLDAYFDPGL